MKNFSQYLKVKMRDPEYKRYYDALEPEFAVIEGVIKNPTLSMLNKIANALGAKLKVYIT